MKPLHKVVTASDVQSCLYYVHVDNVEDEKLRESLEEEETWLEENDHPSTVDNQDGFWKEPALETSSTYHDHPELPPRITPYFQPPTHSLRSSRQPERKPVGSGTRINPRNMDIPPRRSMQNLIGPRPMNQGLRSESSMASATKSEQENPNLKSWPEQQLAGTKQGHADCRKDGSFGDSSQHQGADGSDTINGFQRNAKSTAQSAQPDYGQETSLTLIRRYDGMQWNVAKISTSCTTGSEESHQAQNGISIAISTPGYAKFTDRAVSLDQEMNSHEKATGFFKRQLWKASDRKRPELGKKSASHGSSLSIHGLKAKLKIRKGIQQDIGDEDASENAVSSKGYMFHSPWGGICELSTGIVGRSLKCKHIINSFGSISKADLPSIPASELRFNLPSSTSPNGSSHDSPDTHDKSKESKRSSFLPTKHQRRSSSFEWRGEPHYPSSDEKMDLSLGQERAGGGFGGKQAKLGKLIIEKEGMKMLDLIVAANMGLWWRAYEKKSSTSQ